MLRASNALGDVTCQWNKGEVDWETLKRVSTWCVWCLVLAFHAGCIAAGCVPRCLWDGSCQGSLRPGLPSSARAAPCISAGTSWFDFYRGLVPGAGLGQVGSGAWEQQLGTLLVDSKTRRRELSSLHAPSGEMWGDGAAEQAVLGSFLGGHRLQPVLHRAPGSSWKGVLQLSVGTFTCTNGHTATLFRATATCWPAPIPGTGRAMPRTKVWAQQLGEGSVSC